MMKLEWTHEENGKTSYINTEVNVTKSINSDYGLGGNLICNECDGKLSQFYKCVCGNEYTKGEITKRMDKITGIVYNEEEKKLFMEYSISNTIKVIDEMPLSDVIDNIEFVDTFYEIYNNEDSNGLLKKIHNFLHKKQLVLVAEYGYLGSERAGYIFSTRNKLLLIQLRDGKLIKEQKQTELDVRANGYTEKLKGMTESKNPILYKEFLQKIEQGEQIVKPKIKKEEKPITVEVDFLKEF
jgi:fructose-1,6-bisphosphatase